MLAPFMFNFLLCLFAKKNVGYYEEYGKAAETWW